MVIQLNAKDYTLCRKCDVWYNSEKLRECPLCLAYEGIERVLENQFDVAETFEQFKREVDIACKTAMDGTLSDSERLDALRRSIKGALDKQRGATVTHI